MFRKLLHRKELFDIRFEIYFMSLLAIIFGSLFVPFDFYDTYLLPLLLLVNIIAGIIVVIEKKRLTHFFTLLLLIAALDFVIDIFNVSSTIPRTVMYLLHLSFYALISLNIIKQVWLPRCVNQNLIFGLMCGYISLGMLGFFILSGIEILSPGSFLNTFADQEMIVDGENSTTMLYFSFITLLTIGYGDIVPISEVAQKATMLIGLTGQFYLVIITGIVVGKYINETHT